MFEVLKRLRRPAPAEAPARIARVPEGERIYAVGDIHGRLDLLDDLLARIDADDAARPAAKTTLILLGDLVDRGLDSAGVVERACHLAAAGDRFHAIKGNHEELMLDAHDGDEVKLRIFLRAGGIQTLESYGVDLRDLPEGREPEALIERMRAAIPPTHVAFLRAMADKVLIGDYLFVHAGIRPGVPIDDQVVEEMRWIRDPFLDYRGDHGVVVVHGHSIFEQPALRPNRLGIDTGAYFSGVLTAIGLEGEERWLLQTEASNREPAEEVAPA